MNGTCYPIMAVVPLISAPNLIPYLHLKVPWSAIHSPFTQPIWQYSLGARWAGSEREAKSGQIQLLQSHCQYTCTPLTTTIKKKVLDTCDVTCYVVFVYRLAYCQKIREQLPNTSRHTGKANTGHASEMKRTWHQKQSRDVPIIFTNHSPPLHNDHFYHF